MDGMNEDGTGLLTIGALARLTGIPVKTIRHWSDQDLLPPAARTPAGYRLYGPDAPARLEIVRSLRELGIGTGGDPLRTAARAHASPRRRRSGRTRWTRRSAPCGCSAPCCVRWPRGAAQQRSCRT